jgi:hypothetical protein
MMNVQAVLYNGGFEQSNSGLTSGKVLRRELGNSTSGKHFQAPFCKKMLILAVEILNAFIP